MKRWYVILAVGIVIVAGAATLFLLLAPKPLISSKIKSQLNFTLLLPQLSSMPVDRSSIQYNAGLQLLSFDVMDSGKKIVVSEQPTPQTFTDIPAAFQKVLDGMNDYADFGTNVGTVHLTNPPQLHGGQAAVLNTDGTLLFAKPATSLSQDEWRHFFVNLNVAT